MSQRYLPLHEDLYRIPRAQILGGLWVNGVAPKRLVNLGDYDDLNLTYENEVTEIIGNDSLVQEVRKEIVTKRAGALTFSSRQAQEILKLAGYLGKKKTVTINADAEPFTLGGITQIKIGDIFESEIPDPADAEIVVGAITFEGGTHLNVVDNGDIEVIAIPEGYAAVAATAGTLTVTGSGEVETYEEIQLLATDGAELRLKIVQLHLGGDSIVIPKINLKPDGDVALATGGNEAISISFTGKIIKDITQPADRRMGYAIPNRRAAA